jgi:hypothetical protein
MDPSRRKLKIALFGELSLEEAIDLSRDKYLIDSWITFFNGNAEKYG